MTGRRILLVEDDDSIRTIAAMSLQELGGHQVLAFASGEDALARAAPFAPELLMLDVSMPGTVRRPWSRCASSTIPASATCLISSFASRAGRWWKPRTAGRGCSPSTTDR